MSINTGHSKSAYEPPHDGFARLASAILRQVWPILISQWVGVAFAIIDSVMLGNFSVQALQTISIAASIYVTIVISLMGVVHALIPICSQVIGADKYEDVGELFSQGIWVSLLMSLVAAFALLKPDFLMNLAGELSEQTRTDVTNYLRYSFYGVPAALLFRVVYSVCAASQRTSTVMYLSVASLPLKFFINWVLIFGNLGFNSMGSDGAGISTAAVSWFQLICGLWILFSDAFYKRYKLRLSLPKLQGMMEILRLGIPMGASYLVEICAFTFITLFVAREGAYASGAHQILSNLISFTYMIPMSIGIATAALAARALGAKQWETAHRSVIAGFALGIIGLLITIVVVLLTKQQIISLYTQNLEVALIASGLLSFFPFIHFWDALQCLNTYALRAHRIATIPLVLQTISLLGIGIGVGYYAGFGPAKGAFEFITNTLIPNATTGLASLWLMNAVSLMICAMVLHAWYWHVYRKNII